ncbi:sensor histidine kinase [Stenotrophomonas rhizophila]
MKEKLPRLLLWASDRNEPFINQFDSDLDWARAAQAEPGSICVKREGVQVRLVRAVSGKYSAMAISSDADRLRSKGIMIREAEVLLAAAPGIEAAAERSEKRTKRLIHNLKSLTAKTNQEIFYVLQQDRMINLNKDAIPHVEKEILGNSADAARALLEILKHQSAQKAEFFAFEKLSGSADALRIESHSVHGVLMNAFYLFFGDFEEKKVRAHVAHTQQVANFDYDSMHACIYYLVDNAVKYTRRNSSLNVYVSLDAVDQRVDIRFDMESLTIPEEERDRVFEEGYSGARAVTHKINGEGIGLFQAREMARLNGGEIYLLAGKQLDNEYSRNAFTISLPI